MFCWNKQSLFNFRYFSCHQKYFLCRCHIFLMCKLFFAIVRNSYHCWRNTWRLIRLSLSTIMRGSVCVKWQLFCLGRISSSFHYIIGIILTFFCRINSTSFFFSMNQSPNEIRPNSIPKKYDNWFHAAPLLFSLSLSCYHHRKKVLSGMASLPWCRCPMGGFLVSGCTTSANPLLQDWTKKKKKGDFKVA